MEIFGCGHQTGETKKKQKHTRTERPCSFREDVVIPKLIMPVVRRRSALCHRRASTCLEEFSMDRLLQQAGLNSGCQQTGRGRNALPARIICFIIWLICQLTLPQGNERSQLQGRRYLLSVRMCAGAARMQTHLLQFTSQS